MLSWLARGPSESRHVEDEGATTFIEQPDTPAHLFVARAFKHSLWGTPRATRPSESLRPERPKSADVTAPVQSANHLLSPSKPSGILLTPGTSSLRRSKSVTFGCEGKQTRMLESSERLSVPTPDVAPGRYPTAGSQDVDSKSASKLMAKLRDARTPVSVNAKDSDDLHVRQILADASSVDWKARHESYVKKTERELKTIIAKQQAAKQYARHKDTESQSLAEQLRQEHKRVLALEIQVADLTARLVERTSHAEHRAGLQTKGPKRVTKSPLKTNPSLLRKGPVSETEDAPKRSDRSVTGTHDIWTDALISSPARHYQISPRRTQTASYHDLPRLSPLKERNLNTGARSHEADDQKSNVRVEPEPELSLPQASSPFRLSPRKDVEESFGIGSPSPFRHRQPAKRQQTGGQSVIMDRAKSFEQDDKAAGLSKERQASARERLAARRRARQNRITD